jgi:hypothetical protein
VSNLADLEIALRQDCAYGLLADSHAHRATREDSLQLIKGRDAITAAWVACGKQSISLTHDLGDMIGYTVEGKTPGHRWIWREDGRILREVVVEDSGEPRTALPVHPPLGELRSAKGQYAAGDIATLPPDFPDAARDLANRLHRAWNGRAFNFFSANWLTKVVSTLPDATFQFERAIVDGTKTALLWRVIGHDVSGRRIRLIGSSIFEGDKDETVLDLASLSAQLTHEKIEF